MASAASSSMATEAWQQLIYGEFTETMGIPMLANVSASSSVAEKSGYDEGVGVTIGWQPSKNSARSSTLPARYTVKS